MADDLERYLETEYQADKALIERVQRLTAEVTDVFVRTFRDDSGTWPYELVNEQAPEAPAKYSFSTTAMIVFALSVALGRVRDSTLVPAATRIRRVDGDEDEMRRIDELVARALDCLVRRSRELPTEVAKRAAKGLPEPQQNPLTESVTFGWDDPFTLTWLLEVLADDPNPEHEAFRNDLENRGRERVQDVLADPHPIRRALQIKEDQWVSHAFPLLRTLQLGETLSRKKWGSPLCRTQNLSQVRELLFERVHLHLSESRIPDSEFDAGDLVFSLEGWIITSPVEPDLAIVDRVLEVLKESQEHTPYWRPLRPFKATGQGLVLLPQSVEIANSLLRICDSPGLAPHEYFSRAIELLKAYARWLLGRVFRGFASEDRSDNSRFVGWESEHTYKLDRIHLWQTSQALIFLEHFAAMLQRHVARNSLRLAGLVPLPMERKDSALDPDKGWAQSKNDEPLKSGPEGSPYRIYDQIEADFVKPRAVGGRATASFSMLLYGPPGTGKTTIARRLAEALGFPLVTVTPSDFITSGGEAVEARAKAIFEVLQEQTNLVVLFDEIDHLLLDRDSLLYREQGDIFKLLTPGMLTKLNRLAELRRVVFIVATNYYERIDRAIKRPGRIDARYLVLPPDRDQRARHLAGSIPGWDVIPAQTRESIAQDTVRFTYRELTDLAIHVRKRYPETEGESLGNAILSAVRALPPIITLGGYGSRLGPEAKPDAVDRPWEEFALLVYLELDARGNLPDRPEWLPDALRTALDEGAVVDPQIAARLEGALSSPRNAATREGQRERG